VTSTPGFRPAVHGLAHTIADGRFGITGLAADLAMAAGLLG
jgi:hypothetical protein